MDKKKVYFGVLSMALAAIVIGSSYEMLHVGKEEDGYCVSVIVDDSNNDRWIAMREGLVQAARDYNIDLNYVFSGKFGSAQEEQELIQREVKNGADGIIVQMVLGGTEEFVEMDIPAEMMLLETDIGPPGLYVVTGPDNVEMGKSLGMEAQEGLADMPDGKRIGILCGSLEQKSMRQRLDGVQKILAGTEAEILWTLSADRGDMSRKLFETMQEQEADIVIALGNEETELAVDCLLERETRGMKGCLLYGIGCSEKAVYYLDKGKIQSLVVPNEFDMGYLSMQQMARQMQFNMLEMESQTIDYLVVNRTNLYNEENQKILFPIVQ